MKTIKDTDSFYVLGVKFESIHEAIACSALGVAKDGIYVGTDCERYPCFDAEDYASEDRCFWNIVFAKSQEELDAKLTELKRISPQGNYRKFSEALTPMVYWAGDSFYEVMITDEMQ